MTRAERLLVVVSNLAVGGTGVVYGVMRYALEPADEWAVVNHPWQPHLQHMHIVTAPLLVFAVGLVWSGHVRSKLDNGRSGRTSGVGLVVALLPMVVSGGLIQTSVDPAWRGAWIGLHVAASLVWLVAWMLHPVWSRRRHPDARRESAGVTN